MLPRKCINQCQQEACPFIRDNSNSERYVCQKCGLKTSVERIKIRDFLLALIKITIFALGFID
ncbi:MAG: hypothetical protein F6J86_26155 [Symploca sp. SIO1B1]|nr:hypothetical protein [Symploca sp. SIO1B1]